MAHSHSASGTRYNAGQHPPKRNPPIRRKGLPCAGKTASRARSSVGTCLRRAPTPCFQPPMTRAALRHSRVPRRARWRHLLPFRQARHEIELLRKHPDVCLVGVRDVVPLPEAYSTEYASVVVHGTVRRGDRRCRAHCRPAGHRRALRRRELGHFEAALAEELSRTLVWKITPTEITAKARLHE